MKWMRCRHRDREVFGVLREGQLIVHEGDLFAQPRATGEQLPVDGVEWLMPCRPGKMLALWNNFRAAAEKNGWAIPAEPLYFVKTPNSHAAHGQAIAALPPEAGRVAYEGELAVVIGRICRDVPPERVADVIYGYTVANDVTARDLQRGDVQFTRAKGFDTFCPVGPRVAEGLDPSRLAITTRVNGQVRQQSSTADLIFDVPTLVSFISHVMTLEEGDLISTGTPSGVGNLDPGDVVEVEIEGIGILRNPVRGETQAP